MGKKSLDSDKSSIHHHDDGGTCYFADRIASFVYYCKDCDCLYISLSSRAKDHKTSMFITLAKKEDVQMLINNLTDALQYYTDHAKETAVINAIKTQKHESMVIDCKTIVV